MILFWYISNTFLFDETKFKAILWKINIKDFKDFFGDKNVDNKDGLVGDYNFLEDSLF